MAPSPGEPLPPRDASSPGSRIAPSLAAIPGGRHLVRRPDGSPASVEIAPFFLGRTPVTNLEYACFLESGRAEAPPWWNDPGFRSPRQPVVGITWEEAAAYCAWLGIVAGGRWRLPMEAEWEFAACGGLSAPRTAWGETVPDSEIPQGTLAGPWEVGRGTPNGYGLFDVGTIVHEWCADWREGDPDGGAAASLARRASRGGSWRHRIRWSGPSARSSLPPAYRYSDYGVRVLRDR